MQIPRGTFRSLKKAVRLGALIGEMEKEKFSGSCSILTRGHSIDLVLREGRILLARCDAFKGEAAWDLVLSMQDDEVDASLSDLSIAQIDLTMEFNSDSRVQMKRVKPGVKPSPPFREDNPALQEKPHPGASHKTVAGREGIPPTPVSKTGRKDPVPPETAPETGMGSGTGPKHQASGEQGPGSASNDDLAVFNRDLEALDSMDLESMSEKMRTNYRSMMEKLHLEHLIKKEGG